VACLGSRAGGCARLPGASRGLSKWDVEWVLNLLAPLVNALLLLLLLLLPLAPPCAAACRAAWAAQPPGGAAWMACWLSPAAPAACPVPPACACTARNRGTQSLVWQASDVHEARLLHGVMPTQRYLLGMETCRCCSPPSFLNASPASMHATTYAPWLHDAEAGRQLRQTLTSPSQCMLCCALAAVRIRLQRHAAMTNALDQGQLGCCRHAVCPSLLSRLLLLVCIQTERIAQPEPQASPGAAARLQGLSSHVHVDSRAPA
jgi:hypothetical protein